MTIYYLNEIEPWPKLNNLDIVYLSGTIFTARDCAHKRIETFFKKNKKLPFDLSNSIIFHAGPIIKDKKIISIGSTTSNRMQKYNFLINMLKVKAIVGKGGLDNLDENIIYFSYTGGCAACASKMLELKEVYWDDLSMAEAVFKLKANNFGPLIVFNGKKQNIKKEAAAGIILYEIVDNKLLYLLLKHREGHFSFSKGHLEENESFFDAALREVAEETGIKIKKEKVDKKIFFDTIYYFEKKQESILVEKKVRYFISKIKKYQKIILSKENKEFKFKTFNKAMKLLKYEKDRKILEQVDEIVRQKENL